MQVTEQQKEAITELKEEIDAKDLCISQLQTRMRDLENERAEEMALAQALQIQNHIAEDEVSDPSKRGNSLFSELEERRVKGKNLTKSQTNTVYRHLTSFCASS
jgi:hypothetical protein